MKIMKGAEKLSRNRIDSTPFQTTIMLSSQKPKKQTHVTHGMPAVRGEMTFTICAMAVPPIQL